MDLSDGHTGFDGGDAGFLSLQHDLIYGTLFRRERAAEGDRSGDIR